MLTTMNKLTADFFAAEFPRYQVPGTYENAVATFWQNTEIPFVELDLGLDLDSTYQWCVNNSDNFDLAWNQRKWNQHNQHQGTTWFKQPHSEHRYDLEIQGKRLTSAANLAAKPKKLTRITMPDGAIDLQIQLKKIGIEYSSLKLARLDPGGYLEPHKDAFQDSDCLSHVWIPIHSSEAELKIYPWGKLPHRVGCAYLLNNQSFIHSIVNTSTQPRFVATMRLIVDTVPENIWNLIKHQVQHQWFNHGSSPTGA